MQQRHRDNQLYALPHKRHRSDGGDLSAVYITPKRLVQISSTALERRVRALADRRPLTSAEWQEVKRQRRLVKNREYQV